jgi:hypothetical protein
VGIPEQGVNLPEHGQLSRCAIHARILVHLIELPLRRTYD